MELGVELSDQLFFFEKLCEQRLFSTPPMVGMESSIFRSALIAGPSD
jgi:hypothetical protein